MHVFCQRELTGDCRQTCDRGHDNQKQDHELTVILDLSAVLHVLLTLWWIGALHFIGPESAAATRSVDFGPFATVDWQAFKEAVYLPVLTYSIGLIAVGAVIFALPNAPRAHALARLVLACVGMSILLVAWFASPLTPIIDVYSLDDVIVRGRALLQGHDPHWAADLAAVIFPLNALIGVQAILAALWGVISGDVDHHRYRTAE